MFSSTIPFKYKLSPKEHFAKRIQIVELGLKSVYLSEKNYIREVIKPWWELDGHKYIHLVFKKYYGSSPIWNLFSIRGELVLVDGITLIVISRSLSGW